MFFRMVFRSRSQYETACRRQERCEETCAWRRYCVKVQVLTPSGGLRTYGRQAGGAHLTGILPCDR